MLAATEAAGYTTPTEIQAQAIPPALETRDVLGIAQTGTGKTAAFVLPMLTRLERGRARARMPRSLVLEPTRELAAQVAESLVTYGQNHKLNVALLIGGVSFAEQDRKLDRGADILIATPGRLLDHFERGKLMLNGVDILVVDEADRMLDMGFIPDIERIFKLTPFTRQTLFFSATMPPEIKRITDTFLHNPFQVEASRQSTTASTITQRLVKTASEAKAKRETLRSLIATNNVKNAIIFCNRKRDVSVVQRSLAKHGLDAACIHGDLDQHVRTETLGRFRSGDLQLLVASDVAARGLDIPDVSHVFNYDVPHHAEDYVHRIGRTGRAGREGAAFTLVTPADSKSLRAIESLIDKKIEWTDGNAKANETSADQTSGKDAAAKETSDAETDGKNASAPAKRRRRSSSSAKSAPVADTVASSVAPESDTHEQSNEPVKQAEKPVRDEKRAPRDRKKEASPSRKSQSRNRRRDEPADKVIYADTEYVPDFLLRPARIAVK